MASIIEPQDSEQEPMNESMEKKKVICKKKCCGATSPQNGIVVNQKTDDQNGQKTDDQNGQKTNCQKKCCEKKKEEEKACKKKCCEDKLKKPKYSREVLLRQAKYALALAIFTIVYNLGEGVVAIYYGWEEESIALLGFGCDSFVEVTSAIIVLIQLLTKEKIMDGKGNQQEKGKKKNLKCERTSTVTIGVLLCILAFSAMASAIHRLATKTFPETAIPGMTIALASLSFMFFLWYYKLKAARILNSKTLESDANCSKGCIQLSTTLLAGSLIQIAGTEVFKTDSLWWVDSVAGLLITFFILKDGVMCIKNGLSDNFDGNCGCCQTDSSKKEGVIEENKNKGGNEKTNDDQVVNQV